MANARHPNAFVHRARTSRGCHGPWARSSPRHRPPHRLFSPGLPLTPSLSFLPYASFLILGRSPLLRFPCLCGCAGNRCLFSGLLLALLAPDLRLRCPVVRALQAAVAVCRRPPWRRGGWAGQEDQLVQFFFFLFCFFCFWLSVLLLIVLLKLIVSGFSSGICQGEWSEPTFSPFSC